MQSDIKTLAYVLRRTNYGEADRILNLITPKGKISAIAKGVRKEKSKLAGGVEMFSLVELNIHCGKSELGVVTSAKMLKYYDKLIADFEKMELSARILKDVSLLAENSDSEEYFRIVDQSLAALNAGVDKRLVEIWYALNLLKTSGEEINLYRDANGKKLLPGVYYVWNTQEMAFEENERGNFGENEIKFLRLILGVDLETIKRVKNLDEILSKVSGFLKIVDKTTKH